MVDSSRRLEEVQAPKSHDTRVERRTTKKARGVCSSRLSREKIIGRVNFIVAQHEKRVSYDNSDYSIKWCDAIVPVHGKKEMLSLFYCFKGPVYWEILGNGGRRLLRAT